MADTVTHHPGPYILEPRRIEDTRLLISAPNTSRNVAEVILRGFSAADHAEQEATGKLLAAAPDMLAALNDLIDIFEMTGGDVDVPGTDSWRALYLAQRARDLAEGKLTDAWGCPHEHTTNNADGSDRRCHSCGTPMPSVEYHEDAEIALAYGDNRAGLTVEDTGNGVTIYGGESTSLSDLASHLTRATKGDGGVR